MDYARLWGGMRGRERAHAKLNNRQYVEADGFQSAFVLIDHIILGAGKSKTTRVKCGVTR